MPTTMTLSFESLSHAVLAMYYATVSSKKADSAADTKHPELGILQGINMSVRLSAAKMSPQNVSMKVLLFISFIFYF